MRDNEQRLKDILDKQCKGVHVTSANSGIDSFANYENTARQLSKAYGVNPDKMVDYLAKIMVIEK